MNLGDFDRHLRNFKCKPYREGGNHTIYRNEETGAQSPVPRHNKIGPGIARKVCDELGIEPPKGR